MTRGWQTLGRSGRDRRRSKKTRPRRGQPQGPRPAAPARTETERPQAAPTSRSASAARTPAGILTIRPEEYRYVYGDLKRIAVVDVAIFAVLVLLSFIIR